MISVTAFQPLVVGGGSIEDLRLLSYTHEIDASSGYLRAEITFFGAAAEWYNNGLGRHIETYNEGGQICFEGFVNKITIQHGAVASERGPLLDIGNRVMAAYTVMDFDVYPPVSGGATETTISQNAASQGKYGIIEKIIGAGQATDTAAEQVRDVFLQDNSEPKTINQLDLGSGTYTTITLEVLGYIHWFEAYVYNNASAGFSVLSDKLTDIRAADPNSVFSADNLYITTNAFLVQDAETENRFALDVIKDLLAIGNGTTDARMIFGVYDRRVLWYEPFPTTIAYQHYLYSPVQNIQYLDGAVVAPWNVRPGKWLNVPDFMIGWDDPNLNTNPRNLFIERVTYTYPFGLALEGSSNQRLSQMLAKITYTGGYL